MAVVKKKPSKIQETIDKEIIANEMDRLVRELEEGNLTIDEILLDMMRCKIIFGELIIKGEKQA